jgi:hypothetical protein
LSTGASGSGCVDGDAKNVFVMFCFFVGVYLFVIVGDCFSDVSSMWETWENLETALFCDEIF